MLNAVVLDFSVPRGADTSSLESRLYPFFYLVADKVFEAGIRRDPSAVSGVPFLEQTNTYLAGRPHALDVARNGEGVLFTPDPSLKQSYLLSSGLTAQNAILLLAAAGVEISVPSLTLDIARLDEVALIREKLDEERTNYLIRVAELADQTFQRLISGFYKDAASWAIDQAALKIGPVVRQYELAIRKLDRKLLDRVGLNFIKEGIPAITSALSEKGWSGATEKAIQVTLEVLARNLALSLEERRKPEGVYGVKISKALNSVLLQSDA
jgi:hypothetical protein